MAEEIRKGAEERIDSLRLFVAIKPPPEVLEHVAGIATECRAMAAKLRLDAAWERPEKMHLTLKFLGNVPRARLERLQDALTDAAARHARFTLSLDGLGSFPSRSRPRVIFLSIAGDTEALALVASDVDAACASVDVPRETRAFHGHLTLARVRRAPRGFHLDRLDHRNAPSTAARFRVDELLLVQSVLGKGGATHTVLSHHPLIRDIGEGP